MFHTQPTYITQPHHTQPQYITRSTLLALHRTAVLRHDDIGQETILNLLLRNYLHYNLYDQVCVGGGVCGYRVRERCVCGIV